MLKKVRRATATHMTKLTTLVSKNGGNGKTTTTEEKAVVAAGIAVITAKEEEKKSLLKSEPEKPAIAALPAVKEMTLVEKILKVENLQIVIEKRAKLVQTRSELERFQTASNDFNCSMRLNDSDGNVFTTSFTPGIKKVIDFLKTSFDASIADVEKKITF
jgi:hypothetical protein